MSFRADINYIDQTINGIPSYLFAGSAMASNFWGRIVIGTNKSYKIVLTPVSEFMSEEDGVIVRDTVMGTTDLTK